MQHNGTLTKIENVKFINNIKRGNIPNVYLQPDDPLLYKLMKSEKLFYIFPEHVHYYRIMKAGMKYESKGQLAITDRNIYYTSSVDSFRINFESISNIFKNHSGVEIHKYAVNEKPKVFKGIDAKFITQLIKSISEIREVK